MFNNYRAEITEKVKELGKVYINIDRLFHEEFTLRSANPAILRGEFYYEANSQAVSSIKWLSKEFESILSDLKQLQSKHKGGILDGDKARSQDQYNLARIEQFSGDYHRIMKFVRDCHIINS